MAKQRKSPGRPKKPADIRLSERLELRLSADEKDTFSEAAARQQISLAHWIRLAAWQVVKKNNGAVQLRVL